MSPSGLGPVARLSLRARWLIAGVVIGVVAGGSGLVAMIATHNAAAPAQSSPAVTCATPSETATPPTRGLDVSGDVPPSPWTARAGTTTRQPLVIFNDAHQPDIRYMYALVDWGDCTTSHMDGAGHGGGTGFFPNGGDSFVLVAAHSYQQAGTYRFTVWLSDESGNGAVVSGRIGVGTAASPPVSPSAGATPSPTVIVPTPAPSPTSSPTAPPATPCPSPSGTGASPTTGMTIQGPTPPSPWTARAGGETFEPLVMFTDTHNPDIRFLYALIDWGDCTTSHAYGPGQGRTVAGFSSNGGASYVLSAGHTYAQPGTYRVTVWLNDEAGHGAVAHGSVEVG